MDTVKPGFDDWAPYIGPECRKSKLLYNTECQKVTKRHFGEHQFSDEYLIDRFSRASVRCFSFYFKENSSSYES